NEASSPKPRKLSKEQRIEGAIEDMIFTSRDIDLGYIPYDKLFSAIAEGQRRVEHPAHANSRSGGVSLTNAIWRERGPNNIGGRTRAIMIDAGDPSRNRIWIGSVSGGVWRTEDITQQDPQWRKLTLQVDNLAIGSIAQDPNNLDVIYVGTGEGFPNLDAVTGAGIFKSTDDGETWAWLESTRGSNFQDIHEIYVHTNGDVYAGTSVGGLLRSKDGGNSWEKVLGTSLSGASSNNFYDFSYNEVNQTFYTSNANSVFKSTTGDRGDWDNIGTAKPGFPGDLVRTELAVCATNPEVMYVLGSVDGTASNTYVSNNGGDSWITRSAPGLAPGQDFTNGQAWYDLDIAANPFNCGQIIAGGVPSFESSFQGISWSPLPGDMHVDQHNITFDPKKPGRVLFGNDGGIWLSENGGQTIFDKNEGYVTTQFYAGAIHPDAGSPYLLGGTQDNNSLQITEPGLAPANSVWGGDGVFCFIDQNEPQFQIVSSQGGNYGFSEDGGNDFGGGTSVDGAFINRSGYDDLANILYGQVNGADFFRWKINGLTENVDIAGQGITVSAVKADPNTPNRIYFGGQSGRVVRVDNANEGNPVQGTLVASLPGGASVSCVYLDKQSPDEILVSMFNFGTNLENIWITYDGGTEWISIEGDLPDMPVRWAIFDPADHDRAMIATEAGVWVTDDINGDDTHWEPISPSNGMPFVKVEMLLMRDSDKVVLAATHGRGLFTTDVFSSAAPVILSQPIAYVGQPVLIDGSQSVNAQSYEWDLGDNTVSNEQMITHTYDEAGMYTISLTVNGSVADTQIITILPYLPAPYQSGGSSYAGDFESNPEHFAPFNIQGTTIQRGRSDKPGKDGTNSGASAWVLGLNENLYANNTRAEFYTPMFDLTEPGLYELKFWAKYAIQNRNDGFQIEYSKDGGVNWFQLGSKDDPNWYNYYNANIANGAFPVGKSYFTNAQLNWIQYIKDISFLAGEPTVSFKFIFRADGEEQAQGFAFDDFEVTKYEGELKTIVTVFNAGYTDEQEVTVNWTTGIEYQCKQLILERSYTGFGFTPTATLSAKGIVSAFANNYSVIDQNLRDVVYYRLRVINENTDIGYYHEFYTDTIVLIKDADENKVNSVIPNPFSDRIGISFTSVVTEEVTLRLFDAVGRLVVDQTVVPDAVSYQMDQLNLPVGVYILSVKIGNGEEQAYQLLSQPR
ncbi:MAG TPA: PKD domain-containing protein, partial [Saprospiraceae bacterium]